MTRRRRTTNLVIDGGDKEVVLLPGDTVSTMPWLLEGVEGADRPVELIVRVENVFADRAVRVSIDDSKSKAKAGPFVIRLS